MASKFWLRQATARTSTVRPKSDLFLRVCQFAYERVARPLIFRTSAQTAHERALRLLAWLDGHAWVLPKGLQRVAFHGDGVEVGGVRLDWPLILAAGLIKGKGFASEAEALAVVERGENIIPGWQAMPRIAGAVEFGSFTRWPRLGNQGTVVWREVKTRSSQNRIGLKNPGVRAAAAFLAANKAELPVVYGINAAVSPGVDDVEQERHEILELLGAFLEQGVYPAWFTLNLSCPNTEDDPGGYQTEEKARALCGAAVDCLSEAGKGAIPLWVKIGPTLADDQYRTLMRVFEEVGVQAVVATNTLPMAAPSDPKLMAGVGGGGLYKRALEVAALLMREKMAQGYVVDVIGCGGVQDGAKLDAYKRLGVKAVQYWTALIYRGPLAAAVIMREARHDSGGL